MSKGQRKRLDKFMGESRLKKQQIQHWLNSDSYNNHKTKLHTRTELRRHWSPIMFKVYWKWDQFLARLTHQLFELCIEHLHHDGAYCSITILSVCTCQANSIYRIYQASHITHSSTFLAMYTRPSVSLERSATTNNLWNAPSTSTAM